MRNHLVVPISDVSLDVIYPPAMKTLFWENGIGQQEHADASEGDFDVFEKESWLSRVLLTWGECGFSLVRREDRRPVATVFFTPPRFAPTTFAMPTGPISPDAVALLGMHVDPIEVDTDDQISLLEAVFRHLAARGIRAVEAFGCSGTYDAETAANAPVEPVSGDDDQMLTTELLDELLDTVTPKPCRSTALGAINHEAGEVIRTAILLAADMKVKTPHPIHPKLRRELNAELDWGEAVGRALDRHTAQQFISTTIY